MGRAFCIGMLDFFDINPVSRLPSSNLRTIEAVEKDILNHYPIFIPNAAKRSSGGREQQKDLPPLQQRPAMRKTTTSVQRQATHPRPSLVTAATTSLTKNSQGDAGSKAQQN